MSRDRLPIVGAFYRPPAQIILNALAVGTPLFVEAEPDNQADINACAVFIKSADIPASAHEALELNLPGIGLSLEEVLLQDLWHLGYIPKGFAAQLRSLDIVSLNNRLEGTFSVNPQGQARISFAEPLEIE